MKRFLLLVCLLCTALLVSCGGGGKSSSIIPGPADAELSEAGIDAVLANAGIFDDGVEVVAAEPPSGIPGATVMLSSAPEISRGVSAVIIPGEPDPNDDCWVTGICNLTERFWNTDCVATGTDVTYKAKVLFNDEDCDKAGYEVMFTRDGDMAIGTAFTDADGMATLTEPNVPIGVHTSTVCVTDFIPAGDVNGDGIPDPAPAIWCADLVFTVYNPCCCFCGKGTGKIDSAFPNCDSAQFHFKLCNNNGNIKGKFNFSDGDIRFQNEQITWAVTADNELHFGNGAVYIRVGNHGHPGKGVDFFEVYVWQTANSPEYHNSGLLTHGNVMRKSNSNKTGFGCSCKCDSHGGDDCNDGCDRGKKPTKVKCGQCGNHDCVKRDRCKEDDKPKCSKCDKRDCKDRDQCDKPKCSKCDTRDCKDRDQCDKPKCSKCDKRDCKDRDQCDKPKCSKCDNRDCRDKHQCDKPKCKQCDKRDCKSKDKCKDKKDKDKCKQCGKHDCKSKDKCKDDDRNKCSKCGKHDCKDKHRCGGLVKSIIKHFVGKK